MAFHFFEKCDLVLVLKSLVAKEAELNGKKENTQKFDQKIFKKWLALNH